VLSKRKSLIPVVLLAVGLATACSSPAPGTPGPQVSVSASVSTPTLGPRPKEVKLDGMTFQQTCGLIPKNQRKALGVEFVASTPSKDNDGNDGCNFDHDSSKPNWGILIIPTPQHDASMWLAQGASNTTVKPPITVAGYPAVQTYLTGSDHQCSTDVSVANGQYLDVTYSIDTPGSGVPIDQVCQRGAEIADTVTKNLIAQRG
jgi:Protein of unknown function (DUF3558)